MARCPGPKARCHFPTRSRLFQPRKFAANQWPAECQRACDCPVFSQPQNQASREPTEAFSFLDGSTQTSLPTRPRSLQLGPRCLHESLRPKDELVQQRDRCHLRSTLQEVRRASRHRCPSSPCHQTPMPRLAARAVPRRFHEGFGAQFHRNRVGDRRRSVWQTHPPDHLGRLGRGSEESRIGTMPFPCRRCSATARVEDPRFRSVRASQIRLGKRNIARTHRLRSSLLTTIWHGQGDLRLNCFPFHQFTACQDHRKQTATSMGGTPMPLHAILASLCARHARSMPGTM